MKQPFSIITALSFVLLCGCERESEVWIEDPGGHESAIEIQIVVRSDPYQLGESVNEGDFSIVSACVLPIDTTGGPGHAICCQDGAIIEMKWREATLLKTRRDQHHPAKREIRFDEFRIAIRNEIVRPDGTRHRVSSGPASQPLGNEFDWLISPITFSSEEGKNERALVIRARFLPEIESPKPLPILALAGHAAGTDG